MCCLVKAWQFHPGGSSLTSPPHFLYSFSVHKVGTKGGRVPLGGSPAIIKQHKHLFSGTFQNSIQTFLLFSLPPAYLLFMFQNIHAPKTKVSQDGGSQGFKQ